MTTDVARIKTVVDARDVWISRLMDTSRRNNLLYFRHLKSGTIDLSNADPEALADIFCGRKLSLSRLVPVDYDPKGGAKLLTIARKAQSNLEEKGLETLFLTYGMATWPVDDGGRPPEAPVVLLPIAVEGKRTDSDSLRLSSAGPPQVNIALLHALAEENQLNISEDHLLGPVDQQVFLPDAVLQRLKQRTSEIKGFEIQQHAVIGNFTFQKLSMVKDLKEHAQELVDHEIVSALAGDLSCKELLQAEHVNVDPAELDFIPAENEFMVLDADSSQQVAVHAAARGSNGVIQGPPGCGKSQTIANIITTLIAQGKRVLFIAEKRAALEAVYKRLENAGLGHLALDLHGATVSQKAVMQKVADTLGKIRTSPSTYAASQYSQFEDRRRRAVAHCQMMHAPLPPSGLSPFELQVKLIATNPKVMSKTRWRGPALGKLDIVSVHEASDLLIEAKGFASLFLRTNPPTWVENNLKDGQAVQDALDAAGRLAQETLPRFIVQLRTLVAVAGLEMPITLDGARKVLSLIREVNNFLESWRSDIFMELSPASELVMAHESILERLLAFISGGLSTAARKHLRALAKNQVPDNKAMRGVVPAANDLKKRWTELSTSGESLPRSVKLPDDAFWLLEKISGDLDLLKTATPSVENLGLSELVTQASNLASDPIASLIPAVRHIESRLSGLGLDPLIEEIRESRIPSEKWSALFEDAYYASCYDAAGREIPALAGFRGGSFTYFISSFQALDRDRLQLASDQVRRDHAERAIDAMNRYPDQAALVRAEAVKRARHLPLRKLVSRSADVLTAICPCWMSSPLNVSQLLPADRKYFDVVIFDEASQILPEDATCSILRGSKLVVAGDRYQLPPTTFFADGANEEDEDAPTSGYESLLDQMSAFVEPWSLDWHYRSRDERLIAMSNRHIYGGRLTTFPGIGTKCISHDLVDSIARDGEEESSSAEVLEVVRLITEHAEAQLRFGVESQRESLGVITLGVKHAERIQAALDKALQSKPNLADFLDTSKNNPWFFLKNLERVQGDERDAIILSVGYSKDKNGRLPYRFGPLLQQGGERRLNVAITRARSRMTVVSVFSHTDMDAGRSDKKGVELLRLFLQFAESGGKDTGDIGSTGVGMNPFEASIFDALTARGITLLPQYGSSGYRLDFAATHPERPGEFVLAIECDGASYHSAPTARDRDRLRQQQLEAIGWKFHRIWSTDWFLGREAEIERAVKAWEEAVKLSDLRQRFQTRSQDGIEIPSDCQQQVVSIPPLNNINHSEQRSNSPPVKAFGNLESYSNPDLDSLVKWIISDGILRTTEEIIKEMMPYLGLNRRGPRIVSRLKESVVRVVPQHHC